ncbi:MAG: glycosyltransferase family 39 protein [Acidimicrobiales bacterium]
MAAAPVVACAVAAIAVYLVLAILRARHPFELDWIEGGLVDQVRRVLDGRPLYGAPSVEYVSLPYPPLFPWLAAAVSRLTGRGFLPLRLVSAVASVGCMAVLWAWIRRETGDGTAGLVAAGLLAACFRLAGAWYDIGRVDSLFLLLLLCSLAVARYAATRRAAAFGGLLLFLAFLTKQSAIVAGLPVLAVLLLRPRSDDVGARDRRVGLAFGAAFALPLLASTLLLDRASDGWYRFFLAGSLAGHDLEASAWTTFWTSDLAPLAVGLGVMVAGAVTLYRDRASALLPVGFYAAATAGLFATSWVSKLHEGGYDNVLMPAVAAASLLVGLAFHYLRHGPGWLAAGAALAVVAQFALVAYDPRDQLPTAADRAAGRRFVEAVRAVPGEVLVVSHPWYAVMAGKAGGAHAAAIEDVLRGDDNRAKDGLRASIAAAVRAQRFAAIVFDDTAPGQPGSGGGLTRDRADFPPDLEQWYQPAADPVFAPTADTSALYPVTDLRVRPETWWVPRR